MGARWEEAAEISRGEKDDEMPDYDIIKAWINRVPVTWLGGLLRCVVHRCVVDGFFKNDEAMGSFINYTIQVARTPHPYLRQDNEQE